jgi:hypothetical protein
MEITIRSDSVVCPVPNAYIGMQSCNLAMRWWWCVGSANSYPNEVLGSTPQTWFNGLASSHVSHLTLSGMPKILLYCMEYKRPTTLAPTTEESWAQWGKTLEEINNLSIELNEVYVWLVWILTTKRKSLKRVETCHEKYFTLWLFVMLTCSSDSIF